MVREITFEGANGAVVDALFAQPEGPPRGGIVLMHPATGDKRSMRDDFDAALAGGFGCIAPSAPWARPEPHRMERTPGDVEAHGRFFRQTVADYAAAGHELTRRADLGPRKIALIGRNVGGALAGAVALQNADVVAGVGLACLTQMSQFWPTADHPAARRQRDALGVEAVKAAWGGIADLDFIATAPQTDCQWLLQMGRQDDWTSEKEIETHARVLRSQATVQWFDDGHTFLAPEARAARHRWLLERFPI